MRWLPLLLGLAAGASGYWPLDAQTPVPSCNAHPGFAWLDFWLGSWDVYIQDNQVGSNEIQKILDGCAITEHWTDARGRRGYSLFYFQPVRQTWKQVWVTDQALGRGGLKEKALIARFPDGGVRFQGEIPVAEGGSYLDRTTLTPVTADEVRQVIEVSTDGGATWRVTFDARYRRRR